jgi:hypothetical protein
MHVLGDTMISISADTGKFLNFNLSRKQSDDPEQYDQWRGLTLEEAKQVEIAVLAVVNKILSEMAK